MNIVSAILFLVENKYNKVDGSKNIVLVTLVKRYELLEYFLFEQGVEIFVGDGGDFGGVAGFGLEADKFVGLVYVGLHAFEKRVGDFHALGCASGGEHHLVVDNRQIGIQTVDCGFDFGDIIVDAVGNLDCGYILAQHLTAAAHVDGVDYFLKVRAVDVDVQVFAHYAFGQSRSAVGQVEVNVGGIGGDVGVCGGRGVDCVASAASGKRQDGGEGHGEKCL